MSHTFGRRAGLVALVVFVAACHGGGDKHAAPTTRASTEPTSTSTTTTTSAPPVTTSTTAAVTSTSVATAPTSAPCGPAGGPDTSATVGAPAGTLLLARVSVRATARCTDAVVFAFAAKPAAPPGASIKIVQPPFTLAGSGARVTIAGQRFYQVRFAPAATFDFLAGHATYTGPSSIVAAGTAHVRQLVETDSFEGVVTWIIGVGADDQFAFTETASPPSLTLTF